MHVTFRQLRLFLALADTGSVSAAARALHITQPTASMQLREITESIGIPLYEVLKRRVYLTEAGKELARTARTIANEWDAYRQTVDGLKGLTRGQLRIAVVSTAKYFVPRLLGSFCARYPTIDLSLEILNRDGVITRLRSNLDDLYVMSMPPDDLPLHDTTLMPNPLVVVAPADHPLAAEQHLTLGTLAHERLILREPGSGTRRTIDSHFAKHRFKPARILELGSNEAIKEAVAAGLGLSILSVHAIQARPADQGVSLVHVEGFPLPSNWHIVYPQGKHLSPIARVFHDHLLDHTGEWRNAGPAGGML